MSESRRRAYRLEDGFGHRESVLKSHAPGGIGLDWRALNSCRWSSSQRQIQQTSDDADSEDDPGYRWRFELRFSERCVERIATGPGKSESDCCRQEREPASHAEVEPYAFHGNRRRNRVPAHDLLPLAFEGSSNCSSCFIIAVSLNSAACARNDSRCGRAG